MDNMGPDPYGQRYVSDLMDLYHLCCRKGLYQEAEKIASKAHVMDPENPATDVAIHVARALAKRAKANTAKHAKKVKAAETSSSGANFHNRFTPTGFVSGITPAGTLTPDLGIPLRQDSFAVPNPTSGCCEGKCEKLKAVGELMKQYHALYTEGKYQEALSCAQKAQELDPDNVVAGAAVMVARNQVRITEMNPSEPECVNRVDEAPAKGTECDIRRKLDEAVSVNFKDTKLEQVFEDLREISGLNFVPDTHALAKAGVSLTQHVSLKMENVSLKTVLKAITEQVHLAYVIKDGAVMITPSCVPSAK
jgi:tetratricopeptide (TPR) repeat protein